ncbi:MAG: discoidin domain-containing protein [Sedimentisphaerales bacterium]|nr:discoidin domain-containing protein [Sedimentisphaerales bacterium]
MKSFINLPLCAALLIIGCGCTTDDSPERTAKSNADQPSKEPVLVETYKAFEIVRSQDKFYGLDQAAGELDIEKIGTKGYRCVIGDSPEEVKRLIDKLLIAELIEQLDQTEPNKASDRAARESVLGDAGPAEASSQGTADSNAVKITGESTTRAPVLYTADSVSTGRFAVTYLFDNNRDTFWETTSPFPHWVETDFGPTRKLVRSYALQTGSHGKNGTDSTDRMPKDWQFQGSNDRESWTTLDTQTNQENWRINERRTYNCADPNTYRYYRLHIAAGVNPGVLRLSELTLRTQADPNSVAADTASQNRDTADVTGSESFSLIVLPDTQSYTMHYPEIFTSQTQWIKDNKAAMNIVFVLHEGDFTENDSDLEWQRANTSMTILDGVVPYTFCGGNHDVPNHGRLSADARDNSKLNHYFPVSRFANEPWWGGCAADNPDGRYVFFDAGGMEFMIVSLEFGPNDEMLRWANQVVAEFPEKRTIFLTHCYMHEDDTRSGPGDQWNCRGWAGDGNDGEQMWDEFVKLHKNIFLVLSGHILGDGLGRLTSIGVNGNPVHQILANYQDPPIPVGNGGNGWLRIMTFLPQKDRIEVRTYSPWLDQYATDGQNRFNLPYLMSGTG